MKHLHFKEIESTQDYLKSVYPSVEGFSPWLVTTESQTQGHGRYQRPWIQYPESLAFSFTLPPCQIYTLSSLEVGVLLCECFKNLSLKWPNDLLGPRGKKCGGILIYSLNNQTLLVGVGLNISSTPLESDTFEALIRPKIKNQQKELPRRIYEYILSHRHRASVVGEEWIRHCGHIRKVVEVIDRDVQAEYRGIFEGIDRQDGGALIQTDQQLNKIISGSLNIL